MQIHVIKNLFSKTKRTFAYFYVPVIEKQRGKNITFTFSIYGS